MRIDRPSRNTHSAFIFHKLCVAVPALLLFISSTGHAWDYEGHRWVNQLALASLPTNFPAFVRTPEAQERIAFLAGEADRWRNTADLTLKHFNSPDHYMDLDELPDFGLSVTNLTKFRYEFIGQLAAARALHPSKHPEPDPAQNADRSRGLVGLLPWTLTEYYSKLKSGFSYLKAFEQAGGTPEEIANAQQNIIYIMGVMGHFAGDAVQPLHTTKHFNGWIGDNPKNYSTKKSFHSWVDGGFINKSKMTLGDMPSRVKPARVIGVPDARTKEVEMFPEIMAFLWEQHQLVEPLYALDRDGKLTPENESSIEGRKFIEKQLLKGGHFLGSLWLSAWQQAGPDTYLIGKLNHRKASGNSSGN